MALTSSMDFLVRRRETCVFCRYLSALRVPNLPGRNSKHSLIRAEFNERYTAGERFVILVTAVIETGNYVEQCPGDRRAAAKRFCDLLDATVAGRVPFLLHEMVWDSTTLQSFVDGDSTGSSFVGLAGAGRLGGGDIAILVERDWFRSRNPVGEVRIWTLDTELEAMSLQS